MGALFSRALSTICRKGQALPEITPPFELREAELGEACRINVEFLPR